MEVYFKSELRNRLSEKTIKAKNNIFELIHLIYLESKKVDGLGKTMRIW